VSSRTSRKWKRTKWFEDRSKFISPQEEDGVQSWSGSLDNMEKILENEYRDGKR
jgi:hypothetical protein